MVTLTLKTYKKQTVKTLFRVRIVYRVIEGLRGCVSGGEVIFFVKNGQGVPRLLCQVLKRC